MINRNKFNAIPFLVATILIGVVFSGCVDPTGGPGGTKVVPEPVFSPVEGIYTVNSLRLSLEGVPDGSIEFLQSDTFYGFMDPYAGPITLELLPDGEDQATFKFYARGVSADGETYSDVVTAEYTLRRPVAPPIENFFWGRWMGLGSGEDWYISGSSVWIDDATERYYNTDSNTITFEDYQLVKDSEDVLKYVEDGSSIPTFLYRVAGASSSFSAVLVDSSEDAPSSSARGLSSLGGIDVIIQNLNNQENNQSLETAYDGTLTAEDIIIGDDYLITIPVQEGIGDEVQAEVTALYDEQNVGTLDLANSNANFKMNIRSEKRPDLLLADNVTEYKVYIDITNIGNNTITDVEYEITANEDLVISADDLTGIIGSAVSGSVKTIDLTILCPEINTEEAVKSLNVSITDYNPLQSKTWPETVSLKFYKKYPSFSIYTHYEGAGVEPLVINPSGTPVRISGYTNLFNWQPGRWYIVFGGGGTGRETKYSLGIDTGVSTQWNLLEDSSVGESNNTAETSTQIGVGGSAMQYLGAKDVDFYSFEFQEVNTLVYDGNGFDSGNVPSSGMYDYGELVSFEGNTGNMVEADKVFAGWKGDSSIQTFLGSYGLPEDIRISTGENRVFAAWVPKVKSAGRSFFILEDGTLWDLDDPSEPLLTDVEIADDYCWDGAHWILAVKTDGTLWGYGDNESGQLGLGITIDAGFFQQITSGITGGVSRVEVQGKTTYILGDNGTLYGCGLDGGTLPGTQTDDLFPTPVELLQDVVSFSAGTGFLAAIDTDGALWTVGSNSDGQLGDGSIEGRDTFAMVSATGFSSGVDKIAAGYDHLLILKDDGSVYGLGDNSYHQLGEDAGGDALITPVALTNMNDCSDIFAFAYTSFVLKSDGNLYSTGLESNDQLGRDLEPLEKWYNTPLSIDNVAHVTPSSTGTSYFLKDDGSLWYCGNIPLKNTSGQEQDPVLWLENISSYILVPDGVRVIFNDGSSSFEGDRDYRIPSECIRSYP
ncbi:MAG: hypothetical protein JEY99_10015 [Spirochaetales bacterium]|nr:hypothetical protein [Spirochaetales bacterium]